MHPGRVLFLVSFAIGLPVFSAPPADLSRALQSLSFRGQGFLVKTVDPQKDDLRLFWHDDQGTPLRDFIGLEKFVASKGERLLFAANAGMFEPDGKPVGLLMQDGVEQSPLNLTDGTGNFYLKPNGVFVLNAKHQALVVESSAFTVLLTPVTWATQSGPMLVIGGEIHPDFVADSKNKFIRSGVGVRRDGTIVFAISRKPVNFYDFAALFLDELKCPNALYLDGDISAFYIPGLKDTGPHTFGPLFGLVEKE